MAQYDQAARYLSRLAPLAFFRWGIPRFLEGREYQRFVDAGPLAFPGEPDRVCDTVAEFLPADSLGSRWLVDLGDAQGVGVLLLAVGDDLLGRVAAAVCW